MLLIAELIIVAMLLFAVAMLIKEEREIKRSKVPKASVKEYWNGSERRQAVRIDASLIVRYSVEKKQRIRLNGQMKDVSNNGMRLLANEKLTKGTLLLIEFDLPDAKKIISTEGKVAWTNGGFTERDEIGRRIFHTGIQFVSIKPDDKNKLDAYIKNITEKITP